MPKSDPQSFRQIGDPEFRHSPVGKLEISRAHTLPHECPSLNPPSSHRTTSLTIHSPTLKKKKPREQPSHPLEPPPLPHKKKPRAPPLSPTIIATTHDTAHSQLTVAHCTHAHGHPVSHLRAPGAEPSAPQSSLPADAP